MTPGWHWLGLVPAVVLVIVLVVAMLRTEDGWIGLAAFVGGLMLIGGLVWFAYVETMSR